MMNLENNQENEDELNIDEVQDFSMPRTIGVEDYLSLIPEDCFFVLFSFLNQVDLDALSSVSQMLKCYVERLSPTTPRSRDFLALKLGKQMSCGAKEYVLDRWKHFYSEKFIMSRYEIGYMEFANIAIDNTISILLKVCFASHRPESIVFNCLHFRSCLNIGRLLEWLVTSGIQSLTILTPKICAGVDNDFVKRLSGNIENPSLILPNEIEHSKIFPNYFRYVMTMEKEILDVAPLYRDLSVLHMRVNKFWIMDAVIERLRRNLDGIWRLYPSEEFTYPDLANIVVNLDDDLKIEYEAATREHKISFIEESSQSVRIAFGRFLLIKFSSG